MEKKKPAQPVKGKPVQQAKAKPVKNAVASGQTFLKHVKDHLFMDVGIPAIVIIILLVLVIVKVPYEAKESYTELVTSTKEVPTVVKGEPEQRRECEQTPAAYRVLQEVQPYGKYENGEYTCFAEIKVVPEVEVPISKWTFKYTFDMEDIPKQRSEKKKVWN